MNIQLNIKKKISGLCVCCGVLWLQAERESHAMDLQRPTVAFEVEQGAAVILDKNGIIQNQESIPWLSTFGLTPCIGLILENEQFIALAHLDGRSMKRALSEVIDLMGNLEKIKVTIVSSLQGHPGTIKRIETILKSKEIQDQNIKRMEAPPLSSEVLEKVSHNLSDPQSAQSCRDCVRNCVVSVGTNATMISINQGQHKQAVLDVRKGKKEAYQKGGKIIQKPRIGGKGTWVFLYSGEKNENLHKLEIIVDGGAANFEDTAAEAAQKEEDTAEEAAQKEEMERITNSEDYRNRGSFCRRCAENDKACYNSE
jgi:hypothetical protein